MILDFFRTFVSTRNHKRQLCGVKNRRRSRGFETQNHRTSGLLKIRNLRTSGDFACIMKSGESEPPKHQTTLILMIYTACIKTSILLALEFLKSISCVQKTSMILGEFRNLRTSGDFESQDLRTSGLLKIQNLRTSGDFVGMQKTHNLSFKTFKLLSPR